MASQPHLYLLAYASSWYVRKIAQKEFWDPIGNYDPLPYWWVVDVPALVLYGRDDTNTDSETSARNLHALGKPNLRVVLWEGSGHALEDPAGTGDSRFREHALVVLRGCIYEAGAAAVSE